jgi:cobalamin biosynthesis protein CobT
MTTYKRFGNRWTINECLQLQREFELLQLSVDEIAERHQRTPNAIMFKLDQEGFADYNMLYSNYHHLNDDMIVSNDVASVVEDEDVTSVVDDEDEDDNVSSYSEQDCLADHCSSDEEGDEDEQEDEQEEEQEADDDPHDNDSLKNHVMRLEKQLYVLTEMMIQQSKGKSSFSLFG